MRSSSTKGSQGAQKGGIHTAGTPLIPQFIYLNDSTRVWKVGLILDWPQRTHYLTHFGAYQVKTGYPPLDPKKGGSDSAIKPLKPQFSYLNGSTRVWLKAEYHTFGGYNSLFDPLWGTPSLDWMYPHSGTYSFVIFGGLHPDHAQGPLHGQTPNILPDSCSALAHF